MKQAMPGEVQTPDKTDTEFPRQLVGVTALHALISLHVMLAQFVPVRR